MEREGSAAAAMLSMPGLVLLGSSLDQVGLAPRQLATPGQTHLIQRGAKRGSPGTDVDVILR